MLACYTLPFTRDSYHGNTQCKSNDQIIFFCETKTHYRGINEQFTKRNYNFEIRTNIIQDMILPVFCIFAIQCKQSCKQKLYPKTLHIYLLCLVQIHLITTLWDSCTLAPYWVLVDNMELHRIWDILAHKWGSGKIKFCLQNNLNKDSVFGFLSLARLFPFVFGQNTFNSYDFRHNIIEANKIMADVLLKRRSLSHCAYDLKVIQLALPSLKIDKHAKYNICYRFISWWACGKLQNWA